MDLTTTSRTLYYKYFLKEGMSPREAVVEMIKEAQKMERLPCIQIYLSKDDYNEATSWAYNPTTSEGVEKSAVPTPPGTLGYILGYPVYEGWVSRVEARPLSTYPGLEKLYEIYKIFGHKKALEDAFADFRMRGL